MTTTPDLGFKFSAQSERPRLQWPDGRRVAVIFHMPLEYWPLSESAPARDTQGVIGGPRVPGAPDVGTYAYRQFGYRVGVWRLMSLFDEFGIALSCPLNLEFARTYPGIVKEAKARGWEFAAHANTNRDWMPDFTGDERREREFIRRNLGDFSDVVGHKSRGWVSPAVTPTVQTAKIVAEEGLMFYCDYQNDDQPYLLQFEKGRRSSRKSTVCVPYSSELSDYTLYMTHHYTPDEVVSIIRDHFDLLYAEGKRQGKIMHISMHPQVIGQAYRFRALERVIKYMAGYKKKVWFTNREKVADWYLTWLKERR